MCLLQSKHYIALDKLTAKIVASSSTLQIYMLITLLYILLFSEQAIAVLWQNVTCSKQVNLLTYAMVSANLLLLCGSC